MLFQIPCNLVSVDSCFRLHRNQETKPGRPTVFRRLRQNEPVLKREQRLTQPFPVMTPFFNEGREFFQLFYTDSSLQIRHLQIVAKMTIDIFVVITLGKLAKLPIITMTAEIVTTGRTDTVPAPIAIGEKQSMEQRIACVHTPSFSHGHMMRGIERACPDISPCPCIPGLIIYDILASQRIAVILHKPETIFITKSLYRSKVKRISQCMRDHNRLCLFCQSILQPGNINIVLGHCYIHEYRYGTVLKNGGDCSGKPTCHSNYLISPPDLTLPKFRRSKHRKGKKIS